MDYDFGYGTGLKAIWDKKKGLIKTNACFNVFNLVKPAIGAL